jgi:hypothetical protein
MSDEPNDQPGLLTRIRPIAATVLGAMALFWIGWLAYDFVHAK